MISIQWHGHWKNNQFFINIYHNLSFGCKGTRDGDKNFNLTVKFTLTVRSSSIFKISKKWY